MVCTKCTSPRMGKHVILIQHLGVPSAGKAIKDAKMNALKMWTVTSTFTRLTIGALITPRVTNTVNLVPREQLFGSQVFQVRPLNCKTKVIVHLKSFERFVGIIF